jgi:hypothetical protein
LIRRNIRINILININSNGNNKWRGGRGGKIKEIVENR